MTTVDFYILDSAHKQSVWLFACKLAEEAFNAHTNAIILTTDQQEADTMNKLLWTYKDDSFIPHQTGFGTSPIMISTTLHGAPKTNKLINLTAIDAPENDYEHVIEIVANDPEAKAKARERYKRYRSLSYTLYSHEIKMAEL